MESTKTPQKILVVEDDNDISYLLKFFLERQGYEVTVAADGQVAKNIIEQVTPLPDLVFLDIMLPFVDGIQLLKLIRAKADWNKIPIVMLTAKNAEKDIVSALESGATEYLTKPFQPIELAARVKVLLRASG